MNITMVDNMESGVHDKCCIWNTYSARHDFGRLSNDWIWVFKYGHHTTELYSSLVRTDDLNNVFKVSVFVKPLQFLVIKPLLKSSLVALWDIAADCIRVYVF